MKYKPLPTGSSEIENEVWLGFQTVNQNSCVRTDWISATISQWLNRSLVRIESFCFTFSIWLCSCWSGSLNSLLLSRSGSLPYCFWNMLLNAFLKPLGCATYIRTNGSGLYFAKKNRFVQAKVVCIYPSIVSIRSLPLSKDRLHFSLPLIVQSS